MAQSSPMRKPWVAILQAESLLALQQAEQAQVLLEPVWATSTGRTRYECDRMMALILMAQGRHAEAADVIREAQDLIKNELYADTGVDAASLPIVQATPPEDPAVTLYRTAEAARARADWPVATASVGTIATKYATSPWYGPSRVLAGWILIGQGRIPQADQVWAAFVAQDPTGPWRGVAQIARIDCALEQMCDATAAAARTSELTKMIKLGGDAPAVTGDPGDGWNSLPRELALRQILLEIVAGHQEFARQRAQSLLGVGPDQLTKPISEGVTQPATGVGKLLERLVTSVPLVPAEALVVQQDQTNLRLLLAEWWTLIDEPFRARRILGQVFAPRSPATMDQHCYARMRLADLDYGVWRHEEFRNGYKKAFADRPKNPWAARQKLVLAVDAYARCDQEKEALEQLLLIQRNWPTSSEARAAGWYRGVIAWWAGRWQEAASAWDDLDRRYPGHPWQAVLAADYRPRLAVAIAEKIPIGAQPPPRLHPINPHPAGIPPPPPDTEMNP